MSKGKKVNQERVSERIILVITAVDKNKFTTQREIQNHTKLPLYFIKILKDIDIIREEAVYFDTYIQLEKLDKEALKDLSKIYLVCYNFKNRKIGEQKVYDNAWKEVENTYIKSLHRCSLVKRQILEKEHRLKVVESCKLSERKSKKVSFWQKLKNFLGV